MLYFFYDQYFLSVILVGMLYRKLRRERLANEVEGGEMWEGNQENFEFGQEAPPPPPPQDNDEL